MNECRMILPSLKLTWNLKMGGWKMKFPFGIAYFWEILYQRTLGHFGHLTPACCDTENNAIMSKAKQISAATGGSLAFWHQKLVNQGIHLLKSTWHSPNVLVHMGPLLTYLFGSVGHVFWLFQVSGSQCTDVAGQISWGISMYRCTNGLQQLLEYTLMKTCRCHRLPGNDMVVWTIKSYDRSISLRDVLPSNQQYQHNAVDVRCISSWKKNETVQDYLPCPKTNQVAPQKLMVGSWNVLLGILANFQGRSLSLSTRLLPSLPKKVKVINGKYLL